MNELRKFLLILFGGLVLVAASILVMIYGYGVYPVSWFWVILGGTLIRIFAEIIIAISKAD